jgi:ABC-type dipeptide/oligopeptide/nickel transport system permease subunit
MPEAAALVPAAAIPDSAPASGWGRFAQALAASPTGLFGVGILLVSVFVAIFGGAIAPHSTVTQSVSDRFLGSVFTTGNWSHVLGCDNLGRDIFSRTLVGARTSLIVGTVVVSIALVVGTLVGAVAGFFGGIVDALVMRVADFQLSLPFILVALVFMAVLGPGITSMMLALSTAIWVNYARLVRGETLHLRGLEYIAAARSFGVSTPRIILRHILPAVLPSVLVMATLDMAWVIIFEASLSFLGLGVQPPQPSWGVMISEGRDYLHESAWMTLGPGLAIILTATGLNLLGNFLRDLYDPRLVQR